MRLDFSKLPMGLSFPQDAAKLLPRGGDITLVATSEVWTVKASSGSTSEFSNAILEFRGSGLTYNSNKWLVSGQRADSIIVRINDVPIIEITDIGLGSEFFQLPQMDFASVVNLLLAGNDTIIGTAFDDHIEVHQGNNVIHGGKGNDIISSFSTGTATAVFGGAATDAAWVTAGASSIMRGGDGIDHLYGIDQFRFDDVTVSAKSNVLAYVASYSDLSNMFKITHFDAFEHFKNHGVHEGRAVIFNGEAYLAKYDDLRAAFGDDAEAAALHFIQFGMAEGRDWLI
jgi:Ca2+-binding RTX toxin-like protein